MRSVRADTLECERCKPASFSRQAYVLLLLLTFSFFLFNDRLEQRDLGNYKTDLNQIFRDGRHVGVDVQFSIYFRDLPRDVATATNCRREIGRNRRHAFLGTRIPVHNAWQKPLNEFAPNSHGRRVWSFAQMSWNVKVKGQGHQGQKRAVH